MPTTRLQSGPPNPGWLWAERILTLGSGIAVFMTTRALFFEWSPLALALAVIAPFGLSLVLSFFKSSSASAHKFVFILAVTGVALVAPAAGLRMLFGTWPESSIAAEAAYFLLAGLAIVSGHLHMGLAGRRAGWRTSATLALALALIVLAALLIICVIGVGM